MTFKMDSLPNFDEYSDFEELQEEQPLVGSAFDVCPLTLAPHSMSKPHTCGKVNNYGTIKYTLSLTNLENKYFEIQLP